MLGAIAGDIIGSTREGQNERTLNFELFPAGSTFTDDSVLSVAIADSILNGRPWEEKLREYYHYYPLAGYGGNFTHWAGTPGAPPYNSYGNGSAMRVSPVGWAYDNLDEVLRKAGESAAVSHDHPEGIKGARAVAGAIFLARSGKNKDEIRSFIEISIGYDVNFDLGKLRQTYAFDVSCQGSVPQALATFFAGNTFEEVIRNAVSIGGDTDTIACMAGSIAEAFYGGVPEEIGNKAWKLLDYRLQSVLHKFHKQYNIPGMIQKLKR